jgi:hypothetical protein
VLAAPAVREKHEAPNGVMVRVLAKDVGAQAVTEKRFKIFNTPIIPWEDSDWDSGDEGCETASDEPSDHSSTSTAQKTPKIMTPAKIKATKIVTGVGLLTAAILGIMNIQISHQNSSAS